MPDRILTTEVLAEVRRQLTRGWELMDSDPRIGMRYVHYLLFIMSTTIPMHRNSAIRRRRFYELLLVYQLLPDLYLNNRELFYLQWQVWEVQEKLHIRDLPRVPIEPVLLPLFPASVIIVNNQADLYTLRKHIKKVAGGYHGLRNLTGLTPRRVAQENSKFRLSKKMMQAVVCACVFPALDGRVQEVFLPEEIRLMNAVEG